MAKAVVTFEIGLSQPEGVYLPGQVARGVLTLETVGVLKATAIRLSFKGRSFVHWTEQHLRGPGEPRFKDIRHYSASEEYFDQSVIIFGKGTNEGSEKSYLAAGRYSYPFQFQLPTALPSSFEGDHGYIRYWVKAVVEKGRCLSHVTKMPFTVISPLDLNAIPAVTVPVQESKQKKLCCFCCRSGPITAMLCLEKRGFVPGEPIKFGAEINNMSSRKMGSSSVELKMTTIFRTPAKSRAITKQIAKIKRPSLGKGESDVWSSDSMCVPSLPPSFLTGCANIDVLYTLELRVDPVGPAFDLTIPVEIVIGTIPLHSAPPHEIGGHHSAHAHRSMTHRQPIGVPVLPVQGGHLICNPAHPNQLSNNIPGAPHRGSMGHQIHSSRSSSAPSTTSSVSYHNQIIVSAIYAESAFGKVSIKDDDDDEHTRGQLKFAPCYPYFYWANS